MHIRSLKEENKNSGLEAQIEKKDDHLENNLSKNKDTIKQMRNIVQEKKINPPKADLNEIEKEPKLTSLQNLIELCQLKKEPHLKYELETNVSLVKFEYGRIEISFNEKLEKSFIKNLTEKLLEWTNKRWIISLSKEEGNKTIKDTQIDFQKKNLEDAKKTETYKKIIENFPDAELIDVKKDD